MRCSYCTLESYYVRLSKAIIIFTGNPELVFATVQRRRVNKAFDPVAEVCWKQSFQRISWFMKTSVVFFFIFIIIFVVIYFAIMKTCFVILVMTVTIGDFSIAVIISFITVVLAAAVINFLLYSPLAYVIFF